MFVPVLGDGQNFVLFHSFNSKANVLGDRQNFVLFHSLSSKADIIGDRQNFVLFHSLSSKAKVLRDRQNFVLFHSRVEVSVLQLTWGFLFSLTDDELSYTCKICGNQYKILSSLQRHMKKHSAPPAHTCPCCQRRFYQKWELVRHFGRIHRGSSLIQQICAPIDQGPAGIKFWDTRRGSLLIQQICAPIDQRLNFERRFYQKWELVRHLGRIHRGSSYSANLCSNRSRR